MVDQPESITVIGGGLAGLAAATRLLDRGYDGELILLERAPFLGGRVSTVDYKGHRLDLGQHMHVSGFEFYLEFLARIGLEDKIRTQPRLEAEFRDRSGKIGKVEGNNILPPFHLASSLINFPFISLIDKASFAGPLLSALLFEYEEDDRQVSFGDWLRRRGTTQRSIERLWNQIIIPTLNATVDEVSLPMGMMILKRVLLDKGGGKLGRLDGNLDQIGEKASDFIESHGGKVRLSSPVSTIDPAGDGECRVELTDGGIVKSEIVLSAVPGYRLERILPEPTLNKFSCPFWNLNWNSILNVHLFFSEGVMDREFFGFLEGTAGWVFNVNWNEPNSGDHVCLTLSDPGELENMNSKALINLVIQELSAPLPRIEDASLLDSAVLHQPKATFKPDPGSSSFRQSQNPEIPGLYLAGDWTDTGWPSTMEGAVRSGYLAADEILGSSNR
ncbi:hydroxysqualene dehydroxylase HpnE [Candidatus Bipolaricaulota bacterium]|nr:hydroxysqualene dehydroxylase HpnE [Candidatus Bipolaricaulota bacterium]MBS3791747.1 hydroxysqualene dehydroxylase HpnE [Candidatus Bipolaricaulota bacterium]